MKKPRIQLTDDARFWHRLWSNQAAILSVVVTLQSLLPLWQGIIPDRWFVILGALIGSAGALLRLLKQPAIEDKVRGRIDQK